MLKLIQKAVLFSESQAQERGETALDSYASGLGYLFVDEYYSRKERIIQYLIHYGVSKEDIECLIRQTLETVEDVLQAYLDEFYEFRDEEKNSLEDRECESQESINRSVFFTLTLGPKLKLCPLPLSEDNSREIKFRLLAIIERAFHEYLEIELEKAELDSEHSFARNITELPDNAQELDFLTEYSEQKELPDYIEVLLYRLVVSIVFIEYFEDYCFFRTENTGINPIPTNFKDRSIVKFFRLAVPNIHFPNVKISVKEEDSGWPRQIFDDGIRQWKPLIKRRPTKLRIEEDEEKMTVVKEALLESKKSKTDLYFIVIDLAKRKGKKIRYRTAERWVKAYREKFLVDK